MKDLYLKSYKLVTSKVAHNLLVYYPLLSSKNGTFLTNNKCKPLI